MLRIFGHFVPAATVALVLVEALAISLAFYLGVTVLSGIDPETKAIGGTVALPLFFTLAVLVMMHSSGLYHPDALLDIRRTLTRGALILGLILICAFAITSQIGSRNFVQLRNHWHLIVLLPSAWLLSIVLTRTIFSRISRTGVLRRRVLILGEGPRAHRLHELSKERFGAYFYPVAEVKLNPGADDDSHGGLQLRERVEAQATEDLLTLARRVHASEIVLATDDRRGLPVDQLMQCKLAGIGVWDYADFYERESGRIDLSAVKPSWFIFSDGFRMGSVLEFLKRLFDITLCVVMLVVALPLMALTAIAIALDSRGPILYCQERVGLRGRSFVLLKFRSMTADAERDGAPIWAAKRDPRVTRVGRIIRKLRIDELPQLYNVLRGDMSFVGPRPERPYFVNELARAIPYYLERHAIKPGITGWAQVNYPYGASLDDAKEKLAYDLFYLKNRSLFLDFIILIRTARVVLWPVGAR